MSRTLWGATPLFRANRTGHSQNLYSLHRKPLVCVAARRLHPNRSEPGRSRLSGQSASESLSQHLLRSGPCNDSATPRFDSALACATPQKRPTARHRRRRGPRVRGSCSREVPGRSHASRLSLTGGYDLAGGVLSQARSRIERSAILCRRRGNVKRNPGSVEVIATNCTNLD
jgi:hypothetical protein